MLVVRNRPRRNARSTILKMVFVVLTATFGVVHASESPIAAQVDSDEQQSLSLTAAINLALTQNRSLVLTSLGTRRSELGVAAAQSEFRLSVRPELNAILADDETSSVYGVSVARKLQWGTRLSAALRSEPDAAANGRRERVVIEASQPLFRNAGRLIALEPTTRANQALRSAQRRFENQKADLVVEVVASYENVLRLEQQVRADRAAVVRAAELLRLTQAKERLGRVTRIDTLRVELQHGQALSRLENDTERLASANRDLAELLGLKPDTPLQLSPTTVFAVDSVSPEQGVTVALNNRLDYAQALQDLDDADRGSRIAQRGLLPDVNAVARYERADQAIAGFDGDDRSRWILGLSSNSDLNRSVERVALSQALLARNTAHQIIGVIELSIAREVQQRLLSYRRAHSELGILERNLDHAAARLQLAQRLFEAGRGDNFSVTDAEQAFLDAESQLLSGRSDATLSGYQLLQSLGTLTETPDSLKPQRI